MIPGPPLFVSCPFCNEEKELSSLMSGNTFDAKFWSDAYQDTPSMPRNSFIQKCEHCGKYFILNRKNVKHRYADEGFSFGITGRLSFSETKEAFAQISAEGFESEEEEISVRIVLLHSFNHYYHRGEEGIPAELTPDDWALFVENAKWLISSSVNTLFKAECCREIGDFDGALAFLHSLPTDNDALNGIIDQIRKKVQAKEKGVFMFE